MTASKLSRYPAAYTRLLLSIPDTGSPIEVQMSSMELANRERLNFYNFLKFLRRNPKEAAVFGDRHQRIVVSVASDPTTRAIFIRFHLRNPTIATELEVGLEAALGDLSMPSNLDHALSIVRDESHNVGDLPIPQQTEAPSPFDILDEALKGESK